MEKNHEIKLSKNRNKLILPYLMFKNLLMTKLRAALHLDILKTFFFEGDIWSQYMT